MTEGQIYSLEIRPEHLTRALAEPGWSPRTCLFAQAGADVNIPSNDFHLDGRLCIYSFTETNPAAREMMEAFDSFHRGYSSSQMTEEGLRRILPVTFTVSQEQLQLMVVV